MLSEAASWSTVIYQERHETGINVLMSIGKKANYSISRNVELTHLVGVKKKKDIKPKVQLQILHRSLLFFINI